MRTLGSKQVQALGEATRVLYSANENDEFGDVLIRAADLLFDETKISVDEILIPDGQVVHWADKDFPPSTQALWPEFSHEHPAVKYIASGGKRPVIAISDFLTQREFLHLGLYHEIYRPNAIRDQIATLIPLSASTLGLAICGGKPFTQLQKDCLNALHPHFLPAYEAFQQRRHLTRKLSLYTKALEVARDGIVFCSRSGRIGMANQMARQWMKDYFPAERGVRSELPPELKRALKKGREGSMEVSCARGVIRIKWSPAPDGGFFLLLEESRRDQLRESARAHGLSRRECEVAHGLALGKTNDEISRLLGISRHTARTHVEKILFKLRVSTRTAAVAKLMGSPGD